MVQGQHPVPHAIDVGGQTIRVFDPRVHNEVAGSTCGGARQLGGGPLPPGRPERRRDSRWVVTERPLIITGGELTLADLELKYSPQSKFYIAPVQMRANCGILVIDDFGRQLVSPRSC